VLDNVLIRGGDGTVASEANTCIGLVREGRSNNDRGTRGRQDGSTSSGSHRRQHVGVVCVCVWREMCGKQTKKICRFGGREDDDGDEDVGPSTRAHETKKEETNERTPKKAETHRELHSLHLPNDCHTQSHYYYLQKPQTSLLLPPEQIYKDKEENEHKRHP
jgi:hypothetical protein